MRRENKTGDYLSSEITLLKDLTCCLLEKYFQSLVIVKVGMKSVPGNFYSTKLKSPPKAPFQPPKDIKKIMAEMGAHNTSATSPITGTA